VKYDLRKTDNLIWGPPHEKRKTDKMMSFGVGLRNGSLGFCAAYIHVLIVIKTDKKGNQEKHRSGETCNEKARNSPPQLNICKAFFVYSLGCVLNLKLQNIKKKNTIKMCGTLSDYISWPIINARMEHCIGFFLLTMALQHLSPGFFTLIPLNRNR